MKKNFSLIATIAVIIVLGFGGYYLLNIKKTTYPVSDFDSVVIEWGLGDTLQNSYNSHTGTYRYLNHRDSLISKRLKLRSNNVIYLHNKLDELGFWDLPSIIANPNSDLKSTQTLRYEITLNYQKQQKKITYFTDFNQDLYIANQAKEIQQLITSVINETDERYANP